MTTAWQAIEGKKTERSRSDDFVSSVSVKQQRSLLSFEENRRVYWDPAEQAQIKNIILSKPEISNLKIYNSPHISLGVPGSCPLTAICHFHLFHIACVLYPFLLYDVNGTEEKSPPYWVILLTF